jgi:hypothetical protein
VSNPYAAAATSSDIVLIELLAHHAVAMENATYSAATVMVDADNPVPPEAAAPAATLKRHLATILKAKALKINKFLNSFSLSLIPTKMGKSMEMKLNQERTPQWRTYE